VSLYVSYLLEESVQTQFTAFARGFRKVFTTRVLLCLSTNGLA
jgi:hypothetical protein